MIMYTDGIIRLAAEEAAADAPSETDVRDGVTDQSGAVAVATKPAPPKRIPKLLPPFKVILHNDEVNEFEHVILSIMKLTPLTLEDSVRRTLEAHETGVALLLVTHQERAELYAEQFASMSLTVTIEPE
jgi:ATP-dependent Clp protease adaptor protein ClpS